MACRAIGRGHGHFGRGQPQVSRTNLISTTTATDEASYADDQAQAGNGGGDPGGGVHAADGPDAACFGRSDGRTAQAVNELCNNRRNVTAATALVLARVFGNSPEFWLNLQRRTDLWEAMNSPQERDRIMRTRRLGAAA